MSGPAQLDQLVATADQRRRRTPEGVHRRQQHPVGEHLRGAVRSAAEQRRQTVALDPRFGFAARDLDQCRQEVRLLDRQAYAATLGLARQVDEEGNVQHLAVKVPGVAEDAALLERFAVVGDEGDEGVPAPPVQLTPELAEDVIAPGDLPVVEQEELLHQVRRRGRLPAAQRPQVGHGAEFGIVDSGREAAAERLRRGEGGVRLDAQDHHEERLLGRPGGQFVQPGECLLHEFVDIDRAVLETVEPLREAGIGGHVRVRREARRGIAEFLQPLLQGGEGLLQAVAQFPDAVALGPHPREQRGDRRTGPRGLRDRPFEHRRAFRQGVEVRRHRAVVAMEAEAVDAERVHDP